jgi:hypothetical protein
MTTSREEHFEPMLYNLEYAVNAFYKLNKAVEPINQENIPVDYNNLFLLASYALGVLDTFDETQLLFFETIKKVHRSTISGSSLLVARSSIRNYIKGERTFTSDEYEQLGRTCSSAINLLREKYL